ncbi:zf-CCHC domain-containing protein [Tanacetum coccineum]
MDSKNYKEDIDLWHIIVYGDYKPTIKNMETGKEEIIPYKKLKEDNKKMLCKNDEAKMVLYNALPKKEYKRIFMCKTAKDICNSLVITRQALDKSFSSRNHVRKFLRALPTKWHPKLTTIEEYKDLSMLLLNELIGNLKVYEVVLGKDSETSKNNKEKYNSLALKAKKISSDEEASCSDGDDEEYAMAKGKIERKCFKCGDLNHFISDCPKHSYNDQKAFVGGCWSDSDSDDDPKKDEICLMAHDSNEVLFDTLYYTSSSLDDESLQNEYNKLCKISLRIINKNKDLKTKNEILDNEVCEFKERLKRLDKNNEECKSCIDLCTEMDSLSTKFAKFENSSNFLLEMIKNQRLQKHKKGLGFTEDKASTSGAKTVKMGQESTKVPFVDPAHPVLFEKVSASVKGGYRATVSVNDTLKPILKNRSEFSQITKKTSLSTIVGNTKQPPTLKLGQGVEKSKIQTRPKSPLRRPNTVYPKSDYQQVGDADRKVPVNETFHEQTDDELTEKELKQVEADDQAIQTYFSIAQPGTNMGQDRKMQMIGRNYGNQFRQYVGQNKGLIVVLGIANQNPNGNGNVVAARAEDGSAEVHDYDNCYNNEIFNMFIQEEQYTELLEPIPEPYQVQQNNSNVISEVSGVEQEGEQ